MSATNDPKTVALTYLDAVGRKDFAAVSALLAPDVTFKGPVASLTGQREVTSAYQRVASILVRNEPRKTFVDGDDVCLLYDFVTDTSAGKVPTMEWVRVKNGKIASIELLTDHVRWPAALEEARRRSSAG